MCCCTSIYSRRGSGPELIEDGRDGLLIEPDRPDEIAEAIIRLLTCLLFTSDAADDALRVEVGAFSLPLKYIRH